jgi:phosphomannomutase
VGRDSLARVLEGLGARVQPLGRSDLFIPVDTEAIREEDKELARSWAGEGFDALVSTDGDSDRPLLSDSAGEWLRGDVLGILAARALKIKRVAAPVSCTTALEKSGAFEAIARTRIGSPYVIEAMERLAGTGATVAGYEANGGFLLQTDLESKGRILCALPTRDSFLPIIAVLAQARTLRCTIEDFLRELPQRFTASDRVRNFATEQGHAKILWLQEGRNAETVFGSLAGTMTASDTTDGLRMIFDSGEIIHLRPSGNAPELRCYVEAGSAGRAEELKDAVLGIMETWKA